MSCQCDTCMGATKPATLKYVDLPKITLQQIQTGVATGLYSHVSHNARYAWITHVNGTETIHRIVKQQWSHTDPPNIVRGSE